LLKEVYQLPVYEYKCPECGHRFDVLQPMDAERVADCEKCGAAARRVFSSRIAVKYEGWGFNATDQLLPESSRAKRDFKQLKEKADQIMDGDYSPHSWE
jgi:putative FmdB family regulatory protein